MKLTMKAAIVSMMGLLIALTGTADAARPRAKQNHITTIRGIVVHHRGKPVAGAHVHVMHHHKRQAAGAVMPKARAAKPKAAGANAHRGIMTAADGTFSMRHHHSGTITLVAHKKGVGSGHARVTVGNNATASVMIRLHKHHHHHS